MGLSHTVSGDIASFRTPSRVPIESLKIHFLPKQEGRGGASPVNIRSISGWTESDFDQHGINLWDEDWEIGRINVNTGKNDNNVTSTIRSKNYIPCRPGTKYFIKHSMVTNNLCLFFYDKHKNFISYDWKRSLEVTVPDNCYYLRFYLHSTYGTEYHNDVGINYPSSKMSYVPYSGNARISITFPASGKNQFNPNAEWIIGSTYRYIPFYFGEYDYYMSFTVKDPNVDTSDLYIGFSYFEPISLGDATIGYNWCIEKGVIKQNHTNRISQGATKIYYGLIGKYLLVYPNTEDAYSRLLSAYDIQIEKGTSPTAYEPYASDNIVYGGYIDPVRGKLVAEWATYTFTGTETDLRQNYRASGGTRLLLLFAHAGIQYGENGWVISNILRTTNSAHGDNVCYPRPSSQGCIIDLGRSTICNLTAEEFDALTNDEQVALGKTYIANLYSNGTPLIIAYKLVDPIEYDIDPITLQAFLDHNNFWSDANDITEVTYAVTESKDMLVTRKKAMDFDMGHRKKVKWNQLIVDGQFTDASKWATNVNYGSVSVNNNIGTWTCTVTPDYYYRTGIMESKEHLNIPETHKILMRATVRSSVAIRIALYALALGNEHSNPYYQDITVNEWTTIFGFVVQRNAGKFFGKGKICYGASSQNIGNIVPGTTLEAKDFMMFDLTEMFGLGNEPTTVSEFERICALNGIDLTTYQPYDTGSDRWLIIP